MANYSKTGGKYYKKDGKYMKGCCCASCPKFITVYFDDIAITPSYDGWSVRNLSQTVHSPITTVPTKQFYNGVCESVDQASVIIGTIQYYKDVTGGTDPWTNSNLRIWFGPYDGNTPGNVSVSLSVGSEGYNPSKPSRAGWQINISGETIHDGLVATGFCDGNERPFSCPNATIVVCNNLNSSGRCPVAP